jgi:hypothetical protein
MLSQNKKNEKGWRALFDPEGFIRRNLSRMDVAIELYIKRSREPPAFKEWKKSSYAKTLKALYREIKTALPFKEILFQEWLATL